MLLISLKGINTTNTNEASSSVAHDGRGEAQQSFVGYTSTPVHQSSLTLIIQKEQVSKQFDYFALEKLQIWHLSFIFQH